MRASSEIRMALVGGGMFGGDVVLRTIEDLERCGIAPYLGCVGLDAAARSLAEVRWKLVAIGTRSEASAVRLVQRYSERLPGAAPKPYFGEKPWEEIFASHEVDFLCVATPDHLHAAPVLHALEHDAHVLVEKPLTLSLPEADAILDLARAKGLVVGVDLHKRYDPCHRFLFQELVPRIGKPLYARAVLEEPLEVSTTTFQWAARSDPFSYVGVHWADLFGHYLGLTPASLHAVGQKELLANWSREGRVEDGPKDIDTFDALQVSVDYTSGLRVYYVNAWVNPKEFEGPVNQEMEIVGTRGKIEFDQQYRGLRATISGWGSRTFNPHFTSDVHRTGQSGQGSQAAGLSGYGKDSIVVVAERAAKAILGLSGRDAMRGSYADVESARPTTAIVQAAREVATRNLAALRSGRGTPVTAKFSEAGIEVVDPIAGSSFLYRGNPFSR